MSERYKTVTYKSPYLPLPSAYPHLDDRHCIIEQEMANIDEQESDILKKMKPVANEVEVKAFMDDVAVFKKRKRLELNEYYFPGEDN